MGGAMVHYPISSRKCRQPTRQNSRLDEGSSLYPLDVNLPKPLIQVANEPLISYQLNLLKKAKFSEVLLVVLEEEKAAIEDFIINKYDAAEFGINVVSVDSEIADSSLNVLNAVRNNIKPKSDVFILRYDFVSNLSLKEVADLHRVRDSSFTLVLKQDEVPKNSEDMKKLQKKLSQKGIIKYFGLVPCPESARGRERDQMKLLFAKTLAQDDGFDVSKSLLHKYPQIRLRADLEDVHLYILSRWVLDYIFRVFDSDNNIFFDASLQDDFLPHILSLEHQLETDVKEFEPPNLLGASMSSTFASSLKPQKKEKNKLISCFAHILQPEGSFAVNVSSSGSFLELNQLIIKLPINNFTPWEKFILSSDKNTKGSLISDTAECGESSSVKNSILGDYVKIEEGVKITNSIIMCQTNIKSGTVIQSSVIGENVTVGEKSQIIESQIASQSVLEDKSTLKKEVVAPSYDDITF
eukprot:snap_masked-scaffold_3-processed-gene-7.10-mRNA-1 protein AED:1.00 eAED:1.00 QI:0/0/0/0/1/1/2/0/466